MRGFNTRVASLWAQVNRVWRCTHSLDRRITSDINNNCHTTSVVNVHVAMETPDARVCGSELNNCELVCVYRNRVTVDRVRVKFGLVIFFSILSAVEYRHLHTMEVHRVLQRERVRL